MTAASSRGWGTPDRRVGAIVTVRPAGIALPVNEHVAWLFFTFVETIAFLGYVLNDVLDDWGYAKRFIKGTRTWSNHAWGLAVDLNATKNPMTSDGVVHTDMPYWVIQQADRFGLFWGGHYTGSKKDPMHFEYLGTPAQAAALTAALQAAPPTPLPDTLEEILMGRAFRPNDTGPEQVLVGGRRVALSADDKTFLVDAEYMAEGAPLPIDPEVADYLFGPVIPRPPT